MQAYEGFASVYDYFMSETDYDGWIVYLKKIWERYGFSPKSICDLGCGTGSISLKLYEQGFDMIGIDISLEMLECAREKTVGYSEGGPLFLQQDMSSFELFGTVDLIISLYDCINYVTDEGELLDTFRLVNNYLEPGGLFIFDLNTEYKFKNILSDNTFGESGDDACYLWENYYFEDEGINEYYMNFFVKNKNGSYDRFEETHTERAYSLDKIKSLIHESGMLLLDMFDAYSFNEPNEKSERVFIVARENGKE